jgi:succinoglycan biosynthesis protein ExoM
MPDPNRRRPARVAVCVCTADRPALLARLLAVLERAEPPGAAEATLVVVDNRPAGDGAVREVVDAARARLPFPVVLAEEPVPGISAARNRAVAVALARGADLVAFIDDDDLPRPDWLRRLLETRAATGAEMVFGAQRPSPDMPIRGWARRVALFDPKPRPQLNPYGIPAGASTCNVLLSRRVLEALAADGPPFRPEFGHVGGGDTDLFVRGARLGFPFAVSPLSEIWTMWEPERLTWGGLTRRSFRFGVTRWHLHAVHGERGTRPAEMRRIAWGIYRKAKRIALRAHGKRRFAREYFRLVEQVGEAWALLGGGFEYYGESSAAARGQAPLPPAAAPPPQPAASAAAAAAGDLGAGATAGPTTPPSPIR